MTALQRFAWFNLAVIALTLVVVLVMVPFLGSGAMGGFGLIGLIGLGPFVTRRRTGKVLTDERDVVIGRRSWIIAYSVFWVVFVFAAVVLTGLIYGQDGNVPVTFVQSSVLAGFMLVYGLASIAILVQYARGTSNGE